MKSVKVLLLLLFISCAAIESEEVMNDKYEKAYFGGGCFWCMEPPFEDLEGVIEATSGYMGGSVENPTYEEVQRVKLDMLKLLKYCLIQKLLHMKSC